MEMQGGTKRIRWPDTRLVYNVHRDVCYAHVLSRSALPHRQIDNMRTQNVLHVFLPELARVNRPDEAMDHASMQRLAVVRNGGVPDHDRLTSGTDIRSCAKLLEVRGLSGTAADVARLKATVTPYHNIAAATDRVLTKIPEIVSGDAPEVAAIKARKISLLVREAAMAAYEASCRFCPDKMSPAMSVLLDQVDAHDLLNIARTRPFLVRPLRNVEGEADCAAGDLHQRANDSGNSYQDSYIKRAS